MFGFHFETHLKILNTQKETNIEAFSRVCRQLTNDKHSTGGRCLSTLIFNLTHS